MNLGDGQRFLQLIPARKFRELCKEHEVYKRSRSFEPWDHLSALVLAQVLNLQSLREVEAVLGVKRSTLSNANDKRSSVLFQDLCDVVFARALSQNRKLRKAYRKVLALDSSECSLHGRLNHSSIWGTGRRASVKFHAVWNVDDQWIEDFRITPGKINDQTLAKRLKLARDATYVFDRGYPDLSFWWDIIEAGSHFVTRLKKAFDRRVDHLFGHPRKFKNKTGVLLDQVYRPSPNRLYKHPEVPKHLKLRHIVYKDPKSDRIFDFITSDFQSPAQKIADIYQSRWSVELLFRWMKQHLQLRHPPSQNTNAIEIHLAVSVLIQLLLKLYRKVVGLKGTALEALRHLKAALWSLSHMIADSPPQPPPYTASEARLSS